MGDIFIDLVMNKNKWSYECNGKRKPYDPSMQTEHEHGKYLVVRCEECCNVPVFHLLEKEK